MTRLESILCALGIGVLVIAPTSVVRGAPAHASVPVTEGESLSLTAESLEVDIERGTAVLKGNVQAKMGELELACPRIDLRYDGLTALRFARGTGGIRASYRDIVAKAETLELDSTKGYLALFGGVQLARGRGWVHADQALVNLSTHRISLKGVTGSIPIEMPAR